MEPPGANTYFVQDRENLDEMTRLEIQDKMVTRGQGGVLPELADATALRRVLDVGCGTGDWLIETAQTYPSIETLVGVDISGKMLSHARSKAEALAGRVQFQEMDALRVLELSDGFFDLVNQRFGYSWLCTSDWSKILLEYQRVTRPGGLVRITESQLVQSNSPALTKLCTITLKAFYNSGRFFRESIDGMTCELAHLMTEYGISAVQTRVYTLVFQTGTKDHQDFVENMLYVFRLFVPFFQKWTPMPDDYEEIYQQAKKEMQQRDFMATQTLLTCWGRTSMSGSDIRMRG